MLCFSLVPAAERRLKLISRETKRSVEDLAASAVEEAALEYFRNRNDDPSRCKARQNGGD